MPKILALFAVALLAPALFADSVGYMQGKDVAWDNNVEIKAWSWKQVDYVAEGNKAKVVMRKDLVSVTRSAENGTMSQNLSKAIMDMAASPGDAQDALLAEMKDGTPLNKEHATFLLGQLHASNASGKEASRDAAIKVADYIKAYGNGFFLGDAYPLLARMQLQAADTAGARQAFRDMAKLGAPYDARAQQSLGELELNANNADAALTAFREASKLTSDKNLRFKAEAWASLTLSLQKKWDAAKAIAEPITKDETLDDPVSTDDDAALGIAYRVLGDCLLEGSQTYEKAYDAYMLASYYSWWTQGPGEGYCLAQAWRAASKLVGSDEKWKERKEKLEEALTAGYPNELKAAKAK